VPQTGVRALANPGTGARGSVARTCELAHAAAVGAGALSLTWPAIYNRYPLLYPDSISYLDDGRAVARALFLRQFSEHYGMRSLLYSLGILPFHWNGNPWPVVALQAMLAAYVIWLVLRSVLAAPVESADGAQTGDTRVGAVRSHIVPQYLALMAAVSALTSVAWFASLVMPDVLGPLLYLCLYLLAFACETLSWRERAAVGVIAWWCATSHATHVVIAGGLCVLYWLVVLWRARPGAQLASGAAVGARLRGTGSATLVVLVALASQFGLNAYLNRTFSLNAESPPYVLARVLADGPGRWYLQEHCGAQEPRRFALCDYSAGIFANGDNGDEFLWGPSGVWETAPDEARAQIRREQREFIWAALREYPRAQISISLSNFWRQLGVFGVYIVDANEWMQSQIETVLPGQSATYSNSLEAHNALPLDFFSDLLQMWTIVGSLGVIAIAGFAAAWRRRVPGGLRPGALGVTIISTVLANAFVTGVFSNVEDRYQSRVVWLIPLLAGILLLVRLGRGRPGRSAGAR